MIEGTQFKNNQIVGYPYKTDRALHGIALLTDSLRDKFPFLFVIVLYL